MKSVFQSALLSMIFVSNLTVGSRGTEVTTLQQFLVDNGYLVMPAGVSYGYFGYLTQKALARWQEFNGISPAVGYFGPISQSAFVKQTKSSITPPISAPVSLDVLPSVETDTLTAPGMRVNRVMLFRAFPFEARPGDMIELDGSGFSKTLNKIYFNDGNELTATSTDGIVMKVFVPIMLGEGEYQLSVSNVLGSSDPDIKILLKVTNNPQPAPTIENASLTGDTVTLTGNGFTSSNNLFTTLGDSSGSISSSGNMLTFRLSDLSRYSQTKKFTQGKYQASLWIYVQNEHGINKDPYKLDMVI